MKVNNNNPKHQKTAMANKKEPQPQVFNPKNRRKETGAQALKKHLTVKNIALGALLLFGGVFSYREFYKPNDPFQALSKDYNEKIEIMRKAILGVQKYSNNEKNHELFKEANACLDTMSQTIQCRDQAVKILMESQAIETKIQECMITSENTQCNDNLQDEYLRISNRLDECTSIISKAEKCPLRIVEITVDIIQNAISKDSKENDVKKNIAFKKDDLVEDNDSGKDSGPTKYSHHSVEGNVIVNKNPIKNRIVEDNVIANDNTANDDYNVDFKEGDVEESIPEEFNSEEPL